MNGVAEIIVAAGPGGGPHVKVFSPINANSYFLIDSFFAYDINFAEGVTVGSADINGNGTADILTAPFSDSPSEIRVFDHFTGLIDDFFAFPTGFIGGAFVG